MFTVKKLFRWLLITLAGLMAVVLIGLVALPFIFPLDKIKDFATARLAEVLHREVKIASVSFDLFSGIKLKGIVIGNRSGFAPEPFISAESLDLRYAFWPLFSRQVIVKELALVKPIVLIEKGASGEYNFSDLLGSKPSSPPPAPAVNKTSSKPPFDLFVTSFSIKNGRITYSDQLAKSSSELRNLNVKLSGFELALVKPISLAVSANVTYQGKVIPVSLNGKIAIDLPKEAFRFSPLSFSLAGENILFNLSIAGWKNAPQIYLSAQSKQINLNPILAIFASGGSQTKPQARPGELTASVNRTVAAIPRNLGVKVVLDLKNVSLLNFKLDQLNSQATLTGKRLNLTLKEVRFYNGLLTGRGSINLAAPGITYDLTNLKLLGFDSHPFTNTIISTFLTQLPNHQDLTDKVWGTLDLSANLSGRGVEPQDIMANLTGQASLILKNGELKKIKSLAEAGKLLNSNTLQEDIKFGLLTLTAGITNQIITIKGLKLDQPDLKINFKGGADLKEQKWVPGNRLTLKLSPATTANLPKEYSLLRDDKGWLEMTFELTGDLKKPLPKPILDKPVEAVVGKFKVQIEAKKIEVEQAAQKELDTQKQKLEGEAKKKLQELIKF